MLDRNICFPRRASGLTFVLLPVGELLVAFLLYYFFLLLGRNTDRRCQKSVSSLLISQSAERGESGAKKNKKKNSQRRESRGSAVNLVKVSLIVFSVVGGAGLEMLHVQLEV